MPSEALKNYLDNITDPTNGKVVASSKEISEAIDQYNAEYANEMVEKYGCMTEEIDRYMINSGMMQDKKDYLGASMLVTSVLSDAQELFKNGYEKPAKQFINRAKYILSANRRAVIESDMYDDKYQGDKKW